MNPNKPMKPMHGLMGQPIDHLPALNPRGAKRSPVRAASAPGATQVRPDPRARNHPIKK